MDESVPLFEKSQLLPAISESGFNHDESVEHAESRNLSGVDPIMKDKKNKKKKCKGGPQSPKQILAFNTSEWLKLDENKAENKKCVMVKTLSKSATFPACASLFPVAATCAGSVCAEGSGDSEDCDKQSLRVSPGDKSSVLMRCASVPPKSALRGGYEELGLGPRPKLHVKWAPSVWEPPCTSISHTVNHYHSKKKTSKRRQKGKTSHDDSYKKHGKRNTHKAKHNIESMITVASEKVMSEPKEGQGGNEGRTPSETVNHNYGFSTGQLIHCESDTIGGLESECKLGSEMADGHAVLLKSGVLGGFQVANDSKCAGSLLGMGGMGRIQYNILYGEAM